MDCARKSKNYETVKVLTEHGALDKATNKVSWYSFVVLIDLILCILLFKLLNFLIYVRS